MSEDNIVRWQQPNFNSNCQLECVKSKVKVFSRDNARCQFVYDAIGDAPTLAHFSTEKTVIKLDKSVPFLRFCTFNMW